MGKILGVELEVGIFVDECRLVLVTKVLLLPLVPKGGVPRDPSVENHFPSRILQRNLHHICMDYKKSQFCKKK